MRNLVAAGIGMLAIAGCSTLTEGTSQTLSFESDPPGAECELKRSGMVIGRVTTPGSVLVQKVRADIEATCRKEGYEDATAAVPYDMAVTTIGNALIGGGIGLIIDAASNASIKYTPLTSVTLVAKSTTPPTSATAATNVSPAGMQLASATAIEPKPPIQPAVAKTLDTQAIEKLVLQHFDANRVSYADYIETSSAHSLNARRIVVLRQSPGADAQSWDVVVRVDGDRAMRNLPGGSPGFSQTFHYRAEEQGGTVRIAEWGIGE